MLEGRQLRRVYESRFTGGGGPGQGLYRAAVVALSFVMILIDKVEAAANKSCGVSRGIKLAAGGFRGF